MRYALLLLLIAGCQAPQAQCSVSADCETPYDYLIRSSCPFTSVCMEGTCRVACPQASDPAAEACSADSDCSCEGYAAADIERCACVDGSCVALVRT